MSKWPSKNMPRQTDNRMMNPAISNARADCLAFSGSAGTGSSGCSRISSRWFASAAQDAQQRQLVLKQKVHDALQEMQVESEYEL